jgi:CBS domain-containing protein
MTVAAILRHKGAEVATATPAQTIAEIAGMLSRRRIGAVVVMEGGVLAGILSERDILYALAEHGAATLAMPAAALMTREIQTATPATTYDQAIRAMTEGRFRHMPVIAGGALAGIVSIGDVVKARMMEQEAEVDGLRAYVSGAAA